MLSMVISYFFVEFFVGFYYNSLALVADACHMLSDGLCLVVAWLAIKLSNRTGKKAYRGQTNTYGWVRAEVLGALVNAVFLLALCVIIILEAIQKLIQPEMVQEPKIVAIVGGIGLVMNLLGLFIFGRDSEVMHGHSHGGGGGGEASSSHGHSHGDKEGGNDGQGKDGHGHSHSAGQLNMKGVFLHVLGDAVGSVVVVISAMVMFFYNNCPQTPNDSMTNLDNCQIHQDATTCGDFINDYLQNQYYTDNFKTDNITNIKQYVEDFLIDPTGMSEINATSDIIKNASTTVKLMYPKSKLHWTLYVDPVTSLVLTGLILVTTMGLLKVPMMILLQTVPAHIDPEKIKSELIRIAKDKFQTTITIHDLHVWTLSGDKYVGTVHLKLVNVDLEKYNKLVNKAKDIFHENGIHQITIQPEFATVRRESFGPVSDDSQEDSEQCLLICCDEATTT